MTSPFTFSSNWLARTRFSSTSGPALTTYDCAVALYVIARATEFDADVVSARDGRPLVDHMREIRDGGGADLPPPCTFDLHRRDFDRHVPRVRTPMWNACLSRVASMTDRGEPAFSAFAWDDATDTASFTLAPATLDAHPMMGRKRAAQGTGYLTATVDPALIARMSSVSSVMLACRLAAWWQSGTRVGLQGRTSRLEVAPGRFGATVPVDDVAEVLGIVAARTAPSVMDLTLARVRADMSDHLGLEMITAWEPRSGRARHLALDLEDRASRPMTLAEQAAQCVDESEAPVDVVAAPVVATSPRPVRAGRAVLSRPASVLMPVPVTDPAAPPSEDPHVGDDGLLHDPHDRLAKVRGFLGRRMVADDEGRVGDPVYETDHALLDVGGTWYPHVIYPALDPVRPWQQVTIERPLVEGGPSTRRTSRCDHLPCPDLDRVPHMHRDGVWASESAAVVGRAPPDESLHIDYALPTDGGGELRYAETRADFDAAVATVRGWQRPPYPREIEPAPARKAGSTADDVRREWCEVNGLDADDPSTWTPLDD